MTLKENIVFRLVGLLIFIAPNTGAKFMADVVVRINAILERDKKRSLRKEPA